MQFEELSLNTNPSGHICNLICTVRSENCKLMRVVFTDKKLRSAVSLYGILCFSTVNPITSVLLGDDRIVYKRLVQLTFTDCVYCSLGSLPILPGTKILYTVVDIVPNLCPTATAGIVNVSPG